MLNADGHIKLVDFGLAIITDRMEDSLKKRGVFGTADYVSPEVTPHQRAPRCARRAGACRTALWHWRGLRVGHLG